MQMLKNFAGNQSQANRSVMKTLLSKEQTWGQSKQCAAMNIFFH